VAVTVRNEEPPRTGPVDRRVEAALPNGRVVTFAGTWDPRRLTASSRSSCRAC